MIVFRLCYRREDLDFIDIVSVECGPLLLYNIQNYR